MILRIDFGQFRLSYSLRQACLDTRYGRRLPQASPFFCRNPHSESILVYSLILSVFEKVYQQRSGMNKVTYWLTAKTQYNIHSPFVFNLYNEVLFSRLDPAVARTLKGEGSKRYRQLVYKLEHYFHPQSIERQPGMVTMHLADEVIVVVDSPHSSARDEAEWNRFKSDSRYKVSIDVYDAGLLFSDKRLHRQHFLLR